MASPARPAPAPLPSEERPRFKPHPDDEAEIRAAAEDVAAGRLLSPEKSAAVLRWLETGEGPDPCDSSG